MGYVIDGDCKQRKRLSNGCMQPRLNYYYYSFKINKVPTNHPVTNLLLIKTFSVVSPPTLTLPEIYAIRDQYEVAPIVSIRCYPLLPYNSFNPENGMMLRVIASFDPCFFGVFH